MPLIHYISLPSTNIGTGVRSSTDGASPPSFTTSSSDVHFTCFDPLLTPKLKSVIDVFAHFFTKLFNRSLTTGCIPAVFKAAYISLSLKKVDLDSSDVLSYRPISNLSDLSELLERLVARQVLAISTQTVCYQDSSRRIELKIQRRPLC